MLKNNLIFSEGKIPLVLSLILFFFGFFFYSALILGFLSITFFLFFFRNPTRHLKLDNNLILCPADGLIIEIQEINNNFWSKKVSIFMSPFDVHINWIPMAGKIVSQKYVRGKFKAAFSPKSSELNEHNDIEIEDKVGRKILLRQIAGFVARRIVCWKKTGESVEQGQKYGMIKFSSRVDVFVPKTCELKVVLGQRVYGGLTILGRWQK